MMQPPPGVPRMPSVYVHKKTAVDIKTVYDIGMQLGQPGQFGIAHLCTRKEDGKKFAVKIIDKSKLIFSPSMDRMFADMRSEIEILRALKHPNIIELYEVFETKTELYLVQELCTGGELFDRITQKGKYSEKDASVVIKMILEGIGHMHEAGIVHADLKPDNFLFETPAEDAPLKVIDFGMSKRVPRKTRHLSQLCGTPYYTAPEVLDSHYHQAADLWSVGVVMFVMLFGYPPFYVDPARAGKKENDQIYRKIRKGFKPITKKGYGAFFPITLKASDLAKDLIGKLLETDVAKRFTATEALAHGWFKNAKADMVVPEAIVKHIHEFRNTCHFKIAVLTLFKDNIDPHMKAQLKESFELMDEDKDGKLSYEEFYKHMHTVKGVDPESIRAIFKQVDIDNSNSISFNELLTSAGDHQLRAVDERLKKIFLQLDEDGDGYISNVELKKHMSTLAKDPLIEQLKISAESVMKAADRDADGKISWEEFIEALHPDMLKDAKSEEEKNEMDQAWYSDVKAKGPSGV